VSPAEPLIHWPEPLLELAGFLAAFLAAGAIGFRFGVIARLAPPPAGGLHADERRLRADSLQRAALLGLLGIVVTAVMLGLRLPELAERRHTTVMLLATTNPMVGSQLVFLLMAVLGFALAAARWTPGWLLAAAGVVVSPLRGALFGQWERLVNPVHLLAGGMWLGTLGLLLAVGVTSVMRSGLPSARRGVVVAEMVAAFSPLALGSAAVLVLFGVITAFRHLEYVAALWTTPYGFALLLKLAVVALVFGLGAHNWRRQRPRLGHEAGVKALMGSATLETVLALVVLVITAVLVSLPSPKPPVG
jgi:putative copper export protein